MVLILTALIALSQFNPLLPTLKDLQAKPKADIVTMYSRVCLNLFSDSLGSQDMTLLLRKAFSSTQYFSNTEQMETLFTKICRTNPDLHALDNYDDLLKQAQEKYLELEKSLPNIGSLKNLKLSQSVELLATDGSTIAEIYEKNGRRKWISLEELPKPVIKTFVAVEDRRFFEHKGVDELGILRATLKNSVSKNRPEGASTITQQVARNLFLNDNVSFERKIREILLAHQIESQLTKNQILEIYLNLIYFGRNSWGLYKASQAYFNKPPQKLTVLETAYLAGLVQGPNLYQTKNQRTIERISFVLNKMVEEKIIRQSNEYTKYIENFEIPNESKRSQANYVRDYFIEELKSKNIKSKNLPELKLQTTIHAKLQRDTEQFLQEGLINYEKAAGKYNWQGPLANLSQSIQKNMELANKEKKIRELENSKMQESLFSAVGKGDANSSSSTNNLDSNIPPWLSPLNQISQKLPIPGETWQLAIILENKSTAGLLDGNIYRLSQKTLSWASTLNYGDVVYVTPATRGEWDIAQPPQINGAVIAMDIENGQILAMSGGFHHSLSPWNRATRSLRQPGSLMKPWTYMTALQLGYQPNILLSASPLTFPPSAVGGQSWVPKNYEDITTTPHPMRWALEQSYNIMTAHLMAKTGLGPIRLLARDFGLYDNPSSNYPFILGSQETTLLALTRGYAAIANRGYLVSPHITQIPGYDNFTRTKINSVDEVTLFQIRYLMQGVLERGTARGIANLAPYVAGKTGTSQDIKDTWFVGFTSNMVIGVYVGYDQPETLGSKFAGGNVALPIFDKIIRSSFKYYKKEQLLPAPPPGIVFRPTDLTSGEIKTENSTNSIMEAYRENRILNKSQ